MSRSPYIPQDPPLQYPSVNGKVDFSVEEALRVAFSNLTFIRTRLESVIGILDANKSKLTTISKQVTVMSASGDAPPTVAGPTIITGTSIVRVTIYPPASQTIGTLFYETDTGDLYIISNASGTNTWVLINTGASAVASLFVGAMLEGVCDGYNTVFILSSDPATDTLAFFVDGLLQKIGTDYTLSGSVIITAVPPQNQAHVRAFDIAATGTLTAKDETPTGTINGINTAFTLTSTPAGSSLEYYLNGVLLQYGVDFNISTTSVTMAIPPPIGSRLRAVYNHLTITSSPTGVAGNETPAGSINGVNVTFTLASTPTSSSLRLYQNGILLGPIDYSLAVATITMTIPPMVGTTLTAFYYY